MQTAEIGSGILLGIMVQGLCLLIGNIVTRVALCFMAGKINTLHLKFPGANIFYMAIREHLSRYKGILLYSISLGLLLFLLRWLELRFIIFDHALEVYIGAIALFFTALGIWLAQKLTRPKKETIIVEKEIYINHNNGWVVNEKALQETGLSRREMEVLELMAAGLSNAEIADRLFVSLHTIKTHGSKLFEKMEVKRRTQAIEKAKRLGLIP